MTGVERPRSAWLDYGLPAARVAVAAIAIPLLILSLWVGQGCVDDPCRISRADEWRGLGILVVAGGLLLLAASSRHRLLRYGVWLLIGAFAYVSNRNAEPQLDGRPVTTEAPDLAAVGLALVGSYIPILVLTLGLEWWAARKRRAAAEAGTPIPGVEAARGG